MGRLYLRMSFFCRSLTHHWLFECIVYLLMMLSALLVGLEASRLVHACLHTHKLGTLGKLACSQEWFGASERWSSMYCWGGQTSCQWALSILRPIPVSVKKKLFGWLGGRR